MHLLMYIPVTSPTTIKKPPGRIRCRSTLRTARAVVRTGAPSHAKQRMACSARESRRPGADDSIAEFSMPMVTILRPNIMTRQYLYTW
jgi:hypothetical protein